jgi:ankyrin repeat protein
MDYKEMMQKELNEKCKYLLTFGKSYDYDDDDDEDEEADLIELCTKIIHDASEIGDLKKIVLIIDKIIPKFGIKINIDAPINQSNQTPLMSASREGYPDIVNFLIKNNANVNAARIYSDSPLILVSGNSIMDKDVQLTIVESLISAGANINHIGDYGITPLMMAIDSNSPKIVSKLLQCGADITIKDKNEYTALDLAREFEYEDIVQKIMEYQNK